MDLIDIETPDGTAEAYLTGSGPGVLLLMDVFGIRPQIGQMCDRIAGWGYTVLAPNVFHREGPVADLAPSGPLTAPGEREKFYEVAGQRIGNLTPELARRDLPAYLATLHEHAGPGPVGTVGFCMGARLAMRAAPLDPEVVAVAGFHGAGLAVEDDDESPHLLVSTRAAYAFGHADQDRAMPAEAVELLGRALDDAGVESVNEVYPGAQHGYSMADTSVYDEASTERAFATLRGLLDRTLR